jgi:hypothetical protein
MILVANSSPFKFGGLMKKPLLTKIETMRTGNLPESILFQNFSNVLLKEKGRPSSMARWYNLALISDSGVGMPHNTTATD